MSNLNLGKTFITCLIGRSFAAECFCMKHETLSWGRDSFSSSTYMLV